MIVHLLVEQTGSEPAKGRKPHHVYARCGAESPHRAGTGLMDMTAFSSRVTCDACN